MRTWELCMICRDEHQPGTPHVESAIVGFAGVSLLGSHHDPSCGFRESPFVAAIISPCRGHESAPQRHPHYMFWHRGSPQSAHGKLLEARSTFHLSANARLAGPTCTSCQSLHHSKHCRSCERQRFYYAYTTSSAHRSSRIARLLRLKSSAQLH
jgi:hypothetical protein